MATARVLSNPSAAQSKNQKEEASKIRFSAEHAAEGFAMLLSQGQVQALPGDTYVVGREHLALLNDAGIDYELVG